MSVTAPPSAQLGTLPRPSELESAGSGPAASGPVLSGSAAPKPAKRPRLYALDGLRLLAALGVLSWHWLGVERFPQVWHGSPAKLMPVGHAIGVYGWTGVQLFFIISGFVICMSTWGKSVGTFVTSRVVRLFPAYWVAVLLTALVLSFVPVIWGDDTHSPSIDKILTNLSMANVPINVADVDPVYWSLWAEMRFYVLFGILVAFGLTYRRVLAFCGGWAVLTLVASQANFGLLNVIVQPTYSWYFIAGIVIYLMYRYRPNLMLWGMLGFCWLMAQHSVGSVQGGYAWGAHMKSLSWTICMLSVTVSFVLVLATALGAFSWMRWKWLTVAGSLTYPLYLIHQEIGWELITRLRRHLAPYPTFFVALAVFLLAAYLIHRLVERPLAPWMKRKMEASFAAVRRDMKADEREAAARAAAKSPSRGTAIPG
ncbi:acyltransferase family protein [Streptacidiphilus sp. EB103A]|uniref:acyltransferase family protein n=1 Tax=Streptacidiphilus sp. EB103A TaxID=3156275 RepID=UPI0035174BEC